MVGNDADTNNSPSQNNNTDSYQELLKLATKAQSAGDMRLALHLYLAAYERALKDSRVPDSFVIDGLKKAWDLACKSKERSLAEHIFEKLEPYLSGEEITQYASSLQHLALERLEQFGLSPEDLEDMTETISQGFLSEDPGSTFMRVEQSMANKNFFADMQRGFIRDYAHDSGAQNEVEPSEENLSAPIQHAEGASEKNASLEKSEPEKSMPVSSEKSRVADESHAKDAPILETPESIFNSMNAVEGTPGVFALPGFAANKEEKNGEEQKTLTYKDLVGYGRAIELMKSYGVGIHNDPTFKELVDLLNEKHGLNRMSITDIYLFRSAVREDANQFMLATMGEIDQPVIRMRMEENLQGIPVLCVMASSDQPARLQSARNALDDGGVLILEDVDLWAIPLMESTNEDIGGFFHAQLSRGAREAINLIKSAIENPNVYVLMSSSNETDIDAFIYDSLSPVTLVDIDTPNEAERIELWKNIISEHPSLAGMNLDDLVRYSARMSRFDIYMAAREAVEGAYKESLAAKKYIPVNSAGLFERIAAYQPLESREYRQLENAVIESFASTLDDDLKEWSNNGHHAP